jgi:hypothetical protein
VSNAPVMLAVNIPSYALQNLDTALLKTLREHTGARARIVCLYQTISGDVEFQIEDQPAHDDEWICVASSVWMDENTPRSFHPGKGMICDCSVLMGRVTPQLSAPKTDVFVTTLFDASTMVHRIMAKMVGMDDIIVKGTMDIVSGRLSSPLKEFLSEPDDVSRNLTSPIIKRMGSDVDVTTKHMLGSMYEYSPVPQPFQLL